MGVPFLPARVMLGTDTFRHSAPRAIACPFTGERSSPCPPFTDVAAIHVHEADRYGNCRIRGTTVADLDLARAARKLIVTCERRSPTMKSAVSRIRQSSRSSAWTPYAKAPDGSYPEHMPNEYFSDEVHLRRWLEVERDAEAHRRFLEEHIYGVSDFSEYLQRCGGLPRLQELRRQEFLLHQGR